MAHEYFTGERNKKSYLASALGLVAILSIWFIVTNFHLIEEIFLPSIPAIGKSFYELFVRDSFHVDILTTIGRVLGGFLLSVLVAVPLGILIGTNKVADSCVGPLVKYLRFIPPSAFIPLSIIWLGIGYSQKISIIFLGVFPFITLFVAKECERVPTTLLEAGRIGSYTVWYR